MGFKRFTRDLVFLIIAFQLLTSGSWIFAFYGLVIIGFTVYFYIG